VIPHSYKPTTFSLEALFKVNEMPNRAGRLRSVSNSDTIVDIAVQTDPTKKSYEQE